MPPVLPISDTIKFKYFPNTFDYCKRIPMQVSLGCHVSGVAQPQSDSDPLTSEAGARKRFAHTPPVPDPDRLRRAGLFVKDYVSKHFVPLSPDTDTSIEAWIIKTNYPEKRRAELLDVWYLHCARVVKKDYLVKSFIKAETYPTYKHARVINSRSDVFKCAVGPIFRLIEEVVFKHPSFIKKIPINDRPSYIRNLLYRNGAKYFWGDFTSFEAHFTREIMETFELPLYEHMVQFLPGGADFIKLYKDAIMGTNKCNFRNFQVTIDARRMSGEMNTSLGNGFTNLMLLLFLFKECGEDVTPIVEGDDSNTSFMTSCPTTEDFESLGFTIKCGVSDNFEEMSFCGMIFDPEDLVNITDPIDVLSSFGWARNEYVRCSRKKTPSFTSLQIFIILASICRLSNYSIISSLWSPCHS